METQFINNFAAAEFCAFKDFGTSSEGECSTELIRAQQVSNVGNWERFWLGSSVAVCAASNRQWFYRYWCFAGN